MATQLEEQHLVARPAFKDHYDNFIGGEWKAPRIIIQRRDIKRHPNRIEFLGIEGIAGK